MIIDPFVPQSEAEMTVQQQAMQVVSLYELNSMVRAHLRHTMPDTYWLAAELSELRVASNGHCYMEFVQKDEGSSSVVARAHGHIWRNSYLTISTYFERETGQKLAAGLKILVEVTVTFHELYGYSLQVSAIEPSYTIGEVARRRREIVRRLEEDGVIDLNKELCLPRPLYRIAVISSATAAGYGDFCNQLKQSGFKFETQLFQAVMQGDLVETSVISALDRIAAEAEHWDVVAILRGGGAVTDLHGFDSYLLAANVAQFPLPVFSGIGHERDETIVDLVAHTRFKTPTAVAAFLIESRGGEVVQLGLLQQRLTNAVNQILDCENRMLQLQLNQLQLAATHYSAYRRREFDQLAHRFHLHSTHVIHGQRELLYRLGMSLDVHVHMHLQHVRQQQESIPARLNTAVNRLLDQQHQRFDFIARSLRLAGPERILSLGFSITMKDGKPVRSADELKSGDVLTTQLAQGEVISVVSNAKAKNNEKEN